MYGYMWVLDSHCQICCSKVTTKSSNFMAFYMDIVLMILVHIFIKICVVLPYNIIHMESKGKCTQYKWCSHFTYFPLKTKKPHPLCQNSNSIEKKISVSCFSFAFALRWLHFNVQSFVSSICTFTTYFLIV